MPSVKRIETTSADGFVTLLTDVDGYLCISGGGQMTRALPDNPTLRLPEASLVEAVLEYAHERGLRRTRKPKANGAAKRFRRAKPEMTRPLDDPAVMI